MQRIVYGFGQLSANTMHLDKIIDTCRGYSLKPTKLPQ